MRSNYGVCEYQRAYFYGKTYKTKTKTVDVWEITKFCC